MLEDVLPSVIAIDEYVVLADDKLSTCDPEVEVATSFSEVEIVLAEAALDSVSVAVCKSADVKSVRDVKLLVASFRKEEVVDVELGVSEAVSESDSIILAVWLVDNILLESAVSGAPVCDLSSSRDLVNALASLVLVTTEGCESSGAEREVSVEVLLVLVSIAVILGVAESALLGNSTEFVDDEKVLLESELASVDDAKGSETVELVIRGVDTVTVTVVDDSDVVGRVGVEESC